MILKFFWSILKDKSIIQIEEYNMGVKKYVSVSSMSLQMCKVKNVRMGLSMYMGKQTVKLRTLGQQWRSERKEHGGGSKRPKVKGSHTGVKANAWGYGII